MNPRRRYLYRVTATWAPRDGFPEHTGFWHYQSKAAAEHRAAVLREGRPARTSYDHLNGEVEEAAPIPQAARVSIERSAPVDGWTPVPTTGANQ